MIRKYSKINHDDYRHWYKENQEYWGKTAQDPGRLHFHLMPETGWMNDPNGLCQLNDIYHIYYQYCPFNTSGDMKLWGHYTTKDFIHYTDDGPVLFPDSDADAHGAYSGSAYVENKKIHFFYTGNVKLFDRDDYDYISSGRESNTITFTSENGHDFTEKKLLMTTDDYPSWMSSHVRDPKVFRKNDRYYMMLGGRDKNCKGMALLYESRDLEHWKYKNHITTQETFGYMWECPDLFEINGEWFLSCCPQGVETQGMEYENVHQAVWMKLKYDFDTDEYTIQHIHQMDRGFDFYAQQTFQDEKGRRILIGWMGLPDADYTNPTTDSGWQHALTIPRELSVSDGQLIQKPIEELKQLRKGDPVRYDFGKTAKKHECFNLLTYEAAVEFRQCRQMKITLRKGVILHYDHQILTLELSEGGAGRTTRKLHLDHLESLQIFTDTTSVEIFVNRGKEVFTSRIYSMEYLISIEGDCEGSMLLYPLRSFVVTKNLY